MKKIVLILLVGFGAASFGCGLIEIKNDEWTIEIVCQSHASDECISECVNLKTAKEISSCAIKCGAEVTIWNN